MTMDFYANLPAMPDADRIVQLAEVMFDWQVYFLTSPWHTPGGIDGKLEWVKVFFPDYRKRVLIGNCKEAVAHEGALLIDDKESNCREFEAAGGKAFLYPRPWNRKYVQTDATNGCPLSMEDFHAALKAVF